MGTDFGPMPIRSRAFVCSILSRIRPMPFAIKEAADAPHLLIRASIRISLQVASQMHDCHDASHGAGFDPIAFSVGAVYRGRRCLCRYRSTGTKCLDHGMDT